MFGPDAQCEGFILENEMFRSLGVGKGLLTIKILDLPISF
jgi:hypothetical protein